MEQAEVVTTEVVTRREAEDRDQDLDQTSDRSCESLKKRSVPNFGPEPGPASQVQDPDDRSAQALDAVFMRLEEDMLEFVKEQLRSFHRLLTSEQSESSSERKEQSRADVLNITLNFLRKMDREDLAERLRSKSAPSLCSRGLKTHLQHKFNQVSEGVAKDRDSAPLQQIYTKLRITEGEASEVNQEHEVRLIESMSRRPAERPVTCEDVFKLQPESEQPIRAELTEKGPIRTVMTKGVAGIGKTVLTQKFSLDWAEDKTNQDIDLLLPFTFRELSVLQNRSFSLVELLHHCFSQTKALSSFEDLQMLFIFDGLDECRLPLDFQRTRVLTDPTERASVEELLVNLIRGSLLPSAQIWITTHPAAANQIPAEYVSMVTEVRGFNDQHKEQYFMKRFKDEQQASAVIKHIKSVPSLHVLSRLPLFSWIISEALQKLLEQLSFRQELPKTLTEMFALFLVFQTKVKNISYHVQSWTDLDWTLETREMVRSLGKLAFEQLLKENLIIFERDVIECGLDAAEIAYYSRVFTTVFREEPGLSLYKDKIYRFIHQFVQDFLAALYVHETYYISGRNLLSTPHPSESLELTTTTGEWEPFSSILMTLKLVQTAKAPGSPESYPELSSVLPNPETFYRSAVDLALQSPNGHLDMFLRFLLGLSLPTNESLMSSLLTHRGSNWTNQKTAEYIKQKLNEEGLSAEKSLNLIHCLNELKDHSLVLEMQKVMSEGALYDRSMSPAQWSALSFLLLSSDSDLEEFDLHKYHASEDLFLRLLPLLKVSNTALLQCCNLSSLSCAPLASVLNSSSLKHLDLSDNDLQDSGVKLLCEGLKSAPCRLETLRLSGCLVSERGGACLAAALSSAPSHLRELDLSYNDPGASAELLKDLQSPQGPLLSLRLEPSGAQWLIPGLQKYYSPLTLDQNTVNEFLELSDDGRTVTSVREEQQRPKHPNQFAWPQVLSSSALRARCYYEVQWSGGFVDIAVTYRGVQRRGHMRDCEFGTDYQSWSLRVSVNGFSVHHNNQTTALSSGSSPIHSGSPPRVFSSGQVGVFLNCDSLSFFDVSSGRKILLYTFNTVFTEPVFAGFWLWNHGASVSLLDVTQQRPLENPIVTTMKMVWGLE